MKKKTIFIVEDDLLSAEYLKEILIKENYKVFEIVDTGEAAIQKCKTIEPDILLMDIMLKGQLSGNEAAVEIKHYHPNCKIIFLTAFAEPEMIDYAARSKACAYLMKPYREKEILATIQVVLSQDQISTEATETYLIELLAKNKNHTVSNEQICMYVWNEIKSNSTLRSLIYRFRSIINDDIITNVNGVGYSINT
jgi:DNA-binding response OmpR family regulator